MAITNRSLLGAILVIASTQAIPTQVSYKFFEARADEEKVLDQFDSESAFINDLVKVYASEEALKNAVLGIEIEVNGLTADKVTDLLIDLFGGEKDGQYIRNSKIGTLRVYRDGASWKHEDWANSQNEGKENRLRRAVNSIEDALIAPVELVFPPLKFTELEYVEQAIAALSKNGARGTEGFASASLQVNVQVDSKNTTLLRNILGNYTNNGKLFREYFNPAFIRRIQGFIQEPQEEMQEKLKDYEYTPTAEEFWKDFRNFVPIKMSRVNITPALLDDMSHSVEEKQTLIRGQWGKRPAYELREANAGFCPGYVTELAIVGVALHEASKVTGHVNPSDLHLQAMQKKNTGKISLIPSALKKLKEAAFDHSLKKILKPNQFIRIRVKKSNSRFTFIDFKDIYSKKLADGATLEELKELFNKKFGFEVIRPGEIAEDIPGTEVISLAYDDGYLGRGDGRATWMMEIPIPGFGTLDVGSKGTGLTEYGIPQESIDAGYHIGEKDGYMSLSEGFRTLLNSWILDAIGVNSEKVIGLAETGKTTGHNLNPPVIEEAATLVRYFETGLRGAHLRKYDQSDLKRVALWLREREAHRQGRPGDIPPLEFYLRNKIQRDALRAARAQHWWVVHGALNPANIFENGWADLNYVEALRIPDGKYTPLNVYSRLEFQAQELFKVTTQFVETIRKADPKTKIDTKNEFWTAYHNELTRLELVSAGFSSAQAEYIMKQNPSLAKQYVGLVWDINYNHLKTNTKRLKSLAPMLLAKDGKTNKDLLSYLEKKSERQEKIEAATVESGEMFTKDRYIYRAKEALKKIFSFGKKQDNTTVANREKLHRFLSLTAQMMDILTKHSDATQTHQELAAQMYKRSIQISKVKLPTTQDIAQTYEKYIAQDPSVRDMNQGVAEMQKRMEESKAIIDQMYELNRERPNMDLKFLERMAGRGK